MAHWRVQLLGAVSFNVRITVVHTLNVEAAYNGLVALRDGVEELINSYLPFSKPDEIVFPLDAAAATTAVPT